MQTGYISVKKHGGNLTTSLVSGMLIGFLSWIIFITVMSYTWPENFLAIFTDIGISILILSMIVSTIVASLFSIIGGIVAGARKF